MEGGKQILEVTFPMLINLVPHFRRSSSQHNVTNSNIDQIMETRGISVCILNITSYKHVRVNGLASTAGIVVG